MIVSSERRQRQSVSFGIFKPEEGCHIDDAVAHMATVASLLEKTHNLNVAILRSLDSSWVLYALHPFLSQFPFRHQK